MSNNNKKALHIILFCFNKAIKNKTLVTITDQKNSWNVLNWQTNYRSWGIKTPRRGSKNLEWNSKSYCVYISKEMNKTAKAKKKQSLSEN